MKLLSLLAILVAAALLLGGLEQGNTCQPQTTARMPSPRKPVELIRIQGAGYLTPSLGFLARHTCPENPAPLVVEKARSFVRGQTDLDRSAVLAAVLVPLALLLLIQREILAAAGRREERSFLVFGVAILILLLIVMVVRLRAYAA